MLCEHTQTSTGLPRPRVRFHWVGELRLLGDRAPLLHLRSSDPGSGDGGLTAFLTARDGLAPYDAARFDLIDFDDPTETIETGWLEGSIARGFHGSIFGRELLVFPLPTRRLAADRFLTRDGLASLTRCSLPVLEVLR